MRCVSINLCIGNDDSHAKNLSIYSPPGEGATLTPFYAEVDTSVPGAALTPSALTLTVRLERFNASTPKKVAARLTETR